MRPPVKLQIAKWGNSLAVRLPVACVRATGLRAGDSVDAEIIGGNTIQLTASAPAFDCAAFLKRLEKLHARMEMSEPVVEAMRRAERY